MNPKPIVLIILDGWGYREAESANAIALANTPCWDQLWQHNPHTLLSGCGEDVGLPDGQMGNSEVGHITLGAGRVIYQDLSAIQRDIDNRSFFQNPILNRAIEDAKNNKIHILGLLSPGGVHSHESHLHALLEMASLAHAKHVYFHPILDGRDTPPKSASESLIALEAQMKTLHLGKIATLMGRFYAMDRDQNYARTQLAYDALTAAHAPFQATTAEEALALAYARNETDEFVQPTIIDPQGQIESGDTVIFANFRADRARQLTRAMIEPSFDAFQRQKTPKLQHFVSMTQYANDLNTEVAYPKSRPVHTFGEILANANRTQLRIAETEKYAHVTFFFNGGKEEPYPGEQRILVPSPKVATYDLQPAMSAIEVTDKLIEAIRSQTFDSIICNFANADMVGHTGNMEATIAAVETLDRCLARICEALLTVGGEALITADHGNAELMFNPQTQQPHTAHTHQKVPLVYVGKRAITMVKSGSLKDVAPSLLTLLNMDQPEEMTGQSLVTLYD